MVATTDKVSLADADVPWNVRHKKSQIWLFYHDVYRCLFSKKLVDAYEGVESRGLGRAMPPPNVDVGVPRYISCL